MRGDLTVERVIAAAAVAGPARRAVDIDGVLSGARGFHVGHGLGRMPAPVSHGSRDDGVHTLSVHSPGAAAVGVILSCSLDEHFVGFGEQFTQLDKRGRVIDGWLGQSVNVPAQFTFGLDGGYKIAPLYFSSAGYAVFLESTLRWRFDMAVSNPHEVIVSLPADSIELVVVEGFPAEAIPRITAITGRPPLVEPWVYGAWKNVAGDEQAVLAEAGRLREEGMPCSALWLYAFYDAATNTGCGTGGTYPTGTFPDLAATVAALHGLGFKALTYLNAWIFKNTPCWDEAMREGWTIADGDGQPILATSLHPIGGDETDKYESLLLHTMDNGTATVDLTNPRAREWWQGLLRRVLLEQRFDGWMEDFGEGIPAEARLHDGGVAADSHNRFPLIYHSAASEEIRRSRPDAIFFARSGYLGSQAHVPVFWPGDQTRDWSRESGIGCIPAAGISLGLMGVAAWGPDITGCMGYAELGGGHGMGYDDRELWIRWCQLGAMTPVMREHLGFHGGPPCDAWTDEGTIDTWRRTAGWHLRLFPYLYSAAHQASQSGLPVLRGLMVEFPDDAEAWTVSDEYLLGPALLCAPVLDSGARQRRLYLPQGGWYDCWTGERHQGPAWVEVDAPLERWPVLQREGTVVAMLADTPLDLNDECHREGNFALEVRVAGDSAVPTTLFDGTTLRVEGRRFEADGSIEREYVAATPEGRRLGAGAGRRVTVSLD